MRDRGGYRDSTILEPRVAFRPPGSTVFALILVNVAVYVVQRFALALGQVNLMNPLGVRAHLVVERLWVWQVFTYMFLHSVRGIGHILLNMYVLYLFGTDLEQILGRRRFLVVYLGGGVAGGLAYCMTQYLAGARSPAVGASAAVMAVAVLFAIHFPNRIILVFFILPVKVKWLVLIYIGIDILGSIDSQASSVAHTAHLGGALFGFLYWRFGPAVARFFDTLEDRQREREARRRTSDEERMDRLLAKISREGFDSLTARDRKFLNEQSKRRRQQGSGR